MKREPAPRSPSVTERHYRSLLRELARSGQSVREFAEERGLSPWTLYTWRSRLGLTGRRKGTRRRTEALSRTGQRLLEVAVTGTPRRDPASLGLVLVAFERYRIELPRDVTDDELRRLLAALRAC